MAVISVVMSAYNAESFIKQAIESVLKQEFNDFELILVDDGSTDDTASIYGTFQDQRLIIVKNEENCGQTFSLNRGINLAKGIYIARVDADDIAAPDMLQKMFEFLERSPQTAILGTSKKLIDPTGSVIREFRPPVDNQEIQKTLLTWNCLPHGGIIYRTDCLNFVGCYDESIKLAQDYDLALRLSEPWDAANLSELLYEYRWHDNMISMNRREDQDFWSKRIKEIAIKRRLELGKNLLFDKDLAPDFFRSKSKRWLADRYTWWSMSVRGPGSFIFALKFLLISLIMNPVNSTAWNFISGAFIRKLFLKRVA
ncbi:MAG: hypothetical protein A2Z16_17490 [Chloroflexi bacterium RBG_16_54_18]|nr:MAG: hypothetical protein A2Z16_17490 [Chloroflexi bacterium RBG_16_54_18]